MRRKSAYRIVMGAALVSALLSLRLSAQEQPSFGPTYPGRHAVVIGIDAYEDPGFQDLTYAVRGAQALAGLLVKRYAFAPENVRLILNKDATKDSVEQSLQEWACDAKRVGENDLFLLFFSGHVVTRDGGKQGTASYLVPADGRTRGRDPLWSTLLGMDDLEDVSRFIPAKHAVFIIDSCLAGPGRGAAPFAVGLTNRARQVLTAGTDEQTVQKGSGGHSVFTAALLDALGGLADVNADEIVTFGELFNYVGQRVEHETSGKQTPIHAEFPDHGGGSVAFFPPSVRPPEITDLERLRALELVEDRFLEEHERLSDLVTVSELIEAADQLWPRRPERVPELRDWLGRARLLLDRLPDHEASLQRIRQEAYLTQVVEDTIDEAETNEILMEKLDPATRWRLENFAHLVENLQALEKLIAGVAARLEIALTIMQRTIDDYADEWEDAIADIAESPHYGGLELEPQLGLVPLEPDPESELWEFWLWESGEQPKRDEETGCWRITGESGIVLVLLPRGTFWMGASNDPSSPHNYDPYARPDEGPVHEVTLAPFFLSKYEMTQAQWERVMGSSPSTFAEERVGRPTHPVDNVDWRMSNDTCARIGLVLPTEAQWEYACRGGTDTVWWTGDDPATLECAANLFDRESPVRNPETSPWGVPMPWADLYTRHAPVGSFRPNAFGLHDVHANVSEWCLDWYGSYRLGHREGDGLLQVPEEAARLRVHRGGSFQHVAFTARSGLRGSGTPELRSHDLGCRPAGRVITK
ncbi:MAG: SUMF1/EgtB/PvdO family nonheme iron enzyme [Planctomycetota bacterium]